MAAPGFQPEGAGLWDWFPTTTPQPAQAGFVPFQPRFQPKSCNPQPQEGSAALRGATLSRPERILDEWKADGE
jgi:hypothetical protein